MADESFTSRALNQTVSQLSIPTTPSVSGIATVVAALTGTYEYQVTAFNGGETPVSPAVGFQATGSAVSVTCAPVAGATDYRLYRSISGSNNYHLVAQSATLPVVDKNEISGDAPPSTNTTAYKSRSLGSQASAFYTTPDATRTLLKEILVNNVHDETLYTTVYIVPSGETPSWGNAHVSNVSLEADELKIFSLNTMLESGDAIYAKSDAIGTKQGFGSVNFKISGIEIKDE